MFRNGKHPAHVKFHVEGFKNFLVFFTFILPVWEVYVLPDEKGGIIYINDSEGLTGEVEKCFGRVDMYSASPTGVITTESIISR